MPARIPLVTGGVNQTSSFLINIFVIAPSASSFFSLKNRTSKKPSELFILYSYKYICDCSFCKFFLFVKEYHIKKKPSELFILYSEL